MLSALQWLRLNNIYYCNVIIDHDSLALLPEDGDISGLTSVTYESTNDDSNQYSVADEDPIPMMLTWQERLFPSLDVNGQSKRPSSSQYRNDRVIISLLYL